MVVQVWTPLPEHCVAPRVHWLVQPPPELDDVLDPEALVDPELVDPAPPVPDPELVAVEPPVPEPELVDPELVDPELVDPAPPVPDPELVEVEPPVPEPELDEPELVDAELVDPELVDPELDEPLPPPDDELLPSFPPPGWQATSKAGPITATVSPWFFQVMTCEPCASFALQCGTCSFS
jgi:hypothetical protein